MVWTKNRIQNLFSVKDYMNGDRHYRYGRVQNLKMQDMNGGELITCTVRYKKQYQVSILLRGGQISACCSCQRSSGKYACEHVAAGMIAWYYSKNSDSYMSDPELKNLLQTYMTAVQRPGIHSGKAKLLPRIHPSYNGKYPSFSFQVGFEQLYIIRDIKAFLENVQTKQVVSYGKNLTLYHGLEQFDSQSQELIGILMDQFPSFRSSERISSSAWLSDADVPLGGHNSQKGQITLTGSAFDQLFDMFLEQPIANTSNRKPFTFSNGSPKVSLTLKKQVQCASLNIQTDKKWDFFGNNRNLYATSGNQIFRCDDSFRQNLKPLVDNAELEMQISYTDLPLFCSCVLPVIRDLVEIEDPDSLLEKYLPEECVPCFYFDIINEKLIMRLAFRYGDQIYDTEQKIPASVRRNILKEENARYMAEQYLTEENSHYSLSGDDAIFDFLLDSLPLFHEQGEVYVTDRLRVKRIQPTAAGVGLSVSGGWLNINFDTGGFPPEELESLYRSLLKKKRYYRLKDGRYLELNGSDCETLAEMSHMLQLPAKDLSDGKAVVPAFRALYLDNLLEDNNIQIQRDRQFRSLIRNFRSVSDNEFALPENLELILRPYQKTGFQWLKTLASYGFGGILADEMGLGKTVQVIAFLSTLPEDVDTSLVVCPASLILNWKDEFTKFAPQMHIALIMGTAAERKQIMAESGDADVWVTSYELLRQDIEYYRDRKFDCCILDEGQYIKNQFAQISKAVKQINCQQRFILTGTPLENRLSELWNLFDFLMPGYLFSRNVFVEKLEKPIVRSNDKESLNQLRRMVQPFMLRRLKKNVLKELPPVIEYVRRIPLSEAERKVYTASVLATRENLESDDQGKLAVLAALTRLRQICCAPELCFEDYEGSDSKLEAVLELCSGMVENGHQILLFSQFTSVLDLIRPRLNELKISNFTLQGSTSKAKRAQLVQKFNAGEASVFLISLKAGGTGLNLTAADVVIHYDPWWNTAAQDQATGRAHRIGQKSNVQVYKFIVENTIEERILELQTKKAELMDAIASENSESILNMSKEDLLVLLDS